MRFKMTLTLTVEAANTAEASAIACNAADHLLDTFNDDGSLGKTIAFAHASDPKMPASKPTKPRRRVLKWRRGTSWRTLAADGADAALYGVRPVDGLAGTSKHWEATAVCSRGTFTTNHSLSGDAKHWCQEFEDKERDRSVKPA